MARESTTQEDEHADLLACLWTRILGADAALLRKYERNRDILRDVREKTVKSKGILLEHNHRLVALKASLENLRRKLVSPIITGVKFSTTMKVEDQIRGLEEVGNYLAGVRQEQKSKLMEMVFGGGEYRGTMMIDERSDRRT